MKIKAMWTPTGNTAGLSVCLAGHILLSFLSFILFFLQGNLSSILFYYLIMEAWKCFLLFYIHDVSVIPRWYQRRKWNFTPERIYVLQRVTEQVLGNSQLRHQTKGQGKEHGLKLHKRLLRATKAREAQEKTPGNMHVHTHKHSHRRQGAFPKCHNNKS